MELFEHRCKRCGGDWKNSNELMERCYRAARVINKRVNDMHLKSNVICMGLIMLSIVIVIIIFLITR